MSLNKIIFRKCFKGYWYSECDLKKYDDDDDDDDENNSNDNEKKMVIFSH